jgi:membrane-bound lytic murein transglycosylase MltF
MPSDTDSFGRPSFFSSALLTLLLLTACGQQGTKQQGTKPQGTKQETPTRKTVASSPQDPPPPSGRLVLPINLKRHTDDLDAMVKRRQIRALVTINPIGFFYDKGVPRGAIYETLEEFQKSANKKLGTRGLKIVYIPVRVDQLEGSLTEGQGDFIATLIAVTPDRAKRVAFSVPVERDVTHIVVTGPEYAAISTLEGLGGKSVYVNPLTVYYEELQKVNESLKKNGKTPIEIKAADENLSQDDLIQMVNASLIPATVTTKQRAALWSEVFHDLKAHPEMVTGDEGQLAWVMRKDNPQLKQLVDEFIGTHAVGTSFGNTLLRRYLENTKWVTDSTSKAEIEKYLKLVSTFQKYATEYDFDYLMLAAQGYQESRLNQSQKSPVGAVGIMQVMPRLAAASPIDISDVAIVDGNIHAGAKMLRNTADTYFKDQNIDPMNKTLFVFASYNAGPTRIARLRQEAAAMGLDQNVWFNNVELAAAKEIGQETVTYVGNIYKYYIAYKMAVEQAQSRQKTEVATGSKGH